MRPTSLCLMFAGLVLCTLTSRADDVPFVGTWASETAQCKNDQGVEGAPLILTATSYNQGEAHCTFDSVSQDSGGWLAKAKCSVEGEDQQGTFTFVVEGDKLTIRDDSGERSLSRCP